MRERERERKGQTRRALLNAPCLLIFELLAALISAVRMLARRCSVNSSPALHVTRNVLLAVSCGVVTRAFSMFSPSAEITFAVSPSSPGRSGADTRISATAARGPPAEEQKTSTVARSSQVESVQARKRDHSPRSGSLSCAFQSAACGAEAGGGTGEAARARRQRRAAAAAAAGERGWLLR